MTTLFNENHSIKKQLGVSFLVITVIAVGVCLSIGIGFTAALAKSSYHTAKEGIAKQTNNNAMVDAIELSNAAAKELETIAESVCMMTSKQAATFLGNVHDMGNSNYVFPFKPEDSFREYRFVEGCTFPDCPSDYGDLSSTSRVNGWNGSMVHSSVYLFKNNVANGGMLGAARTDAEWDAAVQSQDYLNAVVNALAYQDENFVELYAYHETAVLFYLSVQICDASCPEGYTFVHRGYPGTQRNSSTYDPPGRSWFRHAPTDAFYLDGPYKETFTGKYVVNLSSRKPLPSASGSFLSLPQPSVVVTGAVLTLDALATIVRGVVYPNDGFGVLIKYSTQEVLVWRNASTDIYNARTGAFYTLGEVDPALGGRDLTRSGTFIYEDGEGLSWLVAVAPFLLSTDGATSTLSEQPALVMLVFSQWDLATASLPALHADIEHTASGVYLTTGIIAGAILLGMLVLMVALISWLTAPLSQIRLILTRIIAISAEEENRRDYREIVDASWFDLKRSDELGCLATSFWYMVIQLHNSCEAKKARPRYTPNPLHM